MAPSLSRTGLWQAREMERRAKEEEEKEKKKKEEEAPLKILVGDVRARIAQGPPELHRGPLFSLKSIVVIANCMVIHLVESIPIQELRFLKIAEWCSHF